MSTLWQRLRKRAPPEEGVFFTVLDVGTTFVKALVCQVRDEGARVVGVGRQRQGAGAMQAGAITDIAAVVKTGDQALRQAEDMTERILGQKAVPDQAVLGIAGNLVKGVACTVRVQRPKPTERITTGELATVVERVERLALNQVREEMAWERRTPAVEIRLVNAAIVGVEIDGYPVVNRCAFRAAAWPSRPSTPSPRWYTWVPCAPWPPSWAWNPWPSSPSLLLWPALSRPARQSSLTSVGVPPTWPWPGEE